MARKTRGQPSRIDQLPPEIKARLDALLRSGVTQREILRRLEEPLREIGEEPLSRSGLNRYATQMEEVGAELREINALADAWTSKLGDEPVGNTGALAIQVLRSLAFQASMRARTDADGSDDGVDIERIGDLALTIQRLERAANLNLVRERELRKAFAAKATKAAEKVIRRAGVSEDTAAKIREAIEGASA